MTRAVLSAALLLSFTVSPVVADECRYERALEAELDAVDAERLTVHAAAGSLRIDGKADADRVLVKGLACASTESALDKIELDTLRRGNRLVVQAEIPDDLFSWRGYARLDLVLTVPDDLALVVEDSSGGIDIRDVASLDLSDSSGEIEIDNVGGNLRIDDSSGEIDVREVEGDVRVRDSSGGMTIEGVGGGVIVDEDGSGEITISAVEGDVEIEEDGSGGITVREVNGGVHIGSDGSGSIYIAHVERGFTLDRDGSGSVHVDDVKGEVRIP